MPIAPDLEITRGEGDGEIVVHLRGRLGIDSSPFLRDQLLAGLREESMKAMVVDVSEVSYMDASGIATLVEGLKIARSCHNILRLKGLQGRVLHLFEMTGLLELFEINGKRSASSVVKVP